MAFEVLLTDDAVLDLEDLYSYIAEHDTPQSADYVLDRLEKTILSLAEFPKRGPYPPELIALGIRDYRQVFFKPYRVIYRVMDKAVYVYVIADGRRDLQSLLQRRLLNA